LAAEHQIVATISRNNLMLCRQKLLGCWLSVPFSVYPIPFSGSFDEGMGGLIAKSSRTAYVFIYCLSISLGLAPETKQLQIKFKDNE
jgi:hypothetical protein